MPFNFSAVLQCHRVNPNVAKVGGLQSQGVKGEIVVGYLDPLTTQDLKSSGFPEGYTTWQNRPQSYLFTKWDIQATMLPL